MPTLPVMLRFLQKQLLRWLGPPCSLSLPTHTPQPVKSFPALKNYLVGCKIVGCSTLSLGGSIFSLQNRTFPLKEPKREIFVARIFTEIRPVWVGDLETRPKNLKSFFEALYYPLIHGIFVNAVRYSAKKIKNWKLGPKKSWFGLLLFSLVWTYKVFWNFEFLLCLKSVFDQFKNCFF
jgi:hypothetical protein